MWLKRYYKNRINKRVKNEDIAGIIRIIEDIEFQDLQKYAVLAILSIGGNNAITELDDLLSRSNEPNFISQIIKYIGEYDNYFNSNFLIPYLAYNNPSFINKAKNGLEWEGALWAVNKVLEEASKVLAKTGNLSAIPSLITAFESGRRGAWDALNKLAKNGWVPKNIKEKIYYLMASEQFYLVVKFGIPAIDPLIKHLCYPHNSCEEEKSMKALISIGIPCVNQLIVTLKDNSNWSGQFHAAYILGEIGDFKAVPSLIDVLYVDYSYGDVIKRLGDTAQKSLTKITGINSIWRKEEWYNWWHEHQKK
jgi:HEAT repeat protein